MSPSPFALSERDATCLTSPKYGVQSLACSAEGLADCFSVAPGLSRKPKKNQGKPIRLLKRTIVGKNGESAPRPMALQRLQDRLHFHAFGLAAWLCLAYLSPSNQRLEDKSGPREAFRTFAHSQPAWPDDTKLQSQIIL